MSADTLPLLSPMSRMGCLGLNTTRVRRAFLVHCGTQQQRMYAKHKTLKVVRQRQGT